MKLLVVFYTIVFILRTINGRVFTKCGLAKELVKQKFPRAEIPNWVCLIENESSRDTAAKGKVNSDGSYDWGLFQINDRYWCKPGYVGGDCKVKCENLMTDNISKASTCAKFVFQRHGFNAWYGWAQRCQGALPDLTDCVY